ncbi:hypothetical protein ACS8E2_05630 [Psychrobacter glaciei]|uniref:hypothetical protein n=1 Tax=Psychrobacter glaciei TaxID=619771 RepID=UPI003F4703FA
MIKQVKFADYQTDITAMMMDMLHLEPQTVDIPIQYYINIDEAGVLKPILWLDGDTIKGVALIFVSTSMRNEALLDAQTDVLWVKPEYRGNSSEFIDGIRSHLKEMGVNHWYAASRDSAPIEGFLERNNFKPLEKLYYCEV